MFLATMSFRPWHGSYTAWMIDRDGLDLGQDLVIWLQGWDEDGGGNTRQMEKMEDGDAKQGEQRRM